MLAYYYSAFGDNALQIGHLLFKRALTECTVMSFDCSKEATQHGVAKLFMPAHLWALPNSGCLRANGGISVLHLCEMRAIVLKGELLRLISNCAVDSVAAI